MTNLHAATRRLVLLASAALIALFAGPLAAQTVDRVAPSQLQRGATTEVIVRGDGLETVTGVAVEGDGFVLSGFVVDSETQLRFRVGVGDRTPLGARDLTLQADTNVVLPDALEFAAGAVQVLTVTPSTLPRGGAATLQIGGRNLDTVTATALGAGITTGTYTAISPVEATLSVNVSASAFAGPRTLELTGPLGIATYAAAVSIEGGAPTVTRLVPASVERGRTERVVIEGTNLDAATGARFGARTTTAGFVVVSPTRAEVDVTVGEDAAAGARDIFLQQGETNLPFAGRFSVTPGALAVTGLRPDRVEQGTSVFLIVDGRNLDGASALDAGPGVTATAFAAGFPTNIEIAIDIAEDAPLGLRDLTLSGPNGSVTLPDAIGVIERVIPPLRLLAPERVSLPAVQAGAVVRGAFQLENAGEWTETVTIGPGTGDTRLIGVVDPDTDELAASITLELVPDEIVEIEFEFRPTERGNFGAIFPITARDGEEARRVIVSTVAQTRRLLFSLDSPTDLGVFDAGVERSLPRLDTLLATGVLPRSRIITDIELVMWRDDALLDATELPITFETASTVAGDILYWGTTEVTWRINAPVGLYRGELRFATDDPNAGLLPFLFTLEVRDGGAEPDDTGIPDAGIPDASDAGSDTTDASDVGSDTADAAPDATPDTAPDATPDTAPDATADTAVDAAPDASSGGSGGGCAAAAPIPGGLLLGLVALLRRRRR